MVTITDAAVEAFKTAYTAANTNDAGRRAGLAEVLSDTHLLREQGLRVLGDEQCCALGCDGGACESCPCCCAGWCVFGHSGEIPSTSDDFAMWLEEAKEHNPVAARLAQVLYAAHELSGEDSVESTAYAAHKIMDAMTGAVQRTASG